MKTARVHHAARRRGGGVAARGARAATQAYAARRRPHARSRTMRKDKPASALSSNGMRDLGWTDGRNVRIEVRCAAGSVAKANDYAAELVSLSPDVHRGQQLPGSGRAAAADPHHSDRIRAGRRSCRRRLCRKPGAAGRQRHRLHQFRICLQRKMAGAAQGDRAARYASGGPARSGDVRSSWAAGGHSSCCRLAARRIEPRSTCGSPPTSSATSWHCWHASPMAG